MSNTDPKHRKSDYPYCFSKLDNVFPLGADGLRHTPESCMPCLYKTECLRAAMKKSEGLKVHEEKLERAYASGAIGFLERWSKKKDLHRRMQQQKKTASGQGEKHEND
ncbi:MAG: hypothetical protein NWR42_13140 [Desulfobacterales bacterium]|nr:hypothetical protein [Desulfobacterales bacterium]